MITTTAAFDCQSKPNHMTMIGATPTMGSAETRLPKGKRPRWRNGLRSMRMAVARPAALPMRKPAKTPCAVCRKSAARVGIEAANFAAIAEGAGRMTPGTPRPRVTVSHSSRIVAPKATGIAILASRPAALVERPAATSQCTQAQPASHMMQTEPQ